MSLLQKISTDHSTIRFIPDDTFYWSPTDKAVYFAPTALKYNHGQWSLLHELAHGLLGHQTYNSDLQLLTMEAEAWHHAKALANKYSLAISDDHIQDCLDTYRDWLHQRSTCPDCNNTGLQSDQKHYKCINCGQMWQVSNARFCRPYRKKVHQKSAASS